MTYNFDQITNRRGTHSLKWDSGEFVKNVMGLTERFDDDTISLFIADMDFPCPDPVIKALHKTVDNKIFGYTMPMDSYYEAIISWFKRRHDWDIKKEEIIYSPGTVNALHVAVKAFTNEGDGVIIQRPVYAPFTGAILENNRNLINNALINNDGYYTIDFDDFEKKAKDPNTKLFILCSPHNPVGRIFSKQELARLSDICAANNVIIIADEIHGDLIRSGNTFYPIVKAAKNTDHIITCTAINKTFNTAGLHCTNIIIHNEKLREEFKKSLGFVMPTPFTINALIAAYNEGEEWLSQVNEYIDGNLQFIVDFLKENMPKVKMRMPEGTYIAWLDFGAYGLTPEEVKYRISSKANVLLEYGGIFGEEGANYQRICVPSPRPIIKEAMERIAKAFSDL